MSGVTSNDVEEWLGTSLTEKDKKVLGTITQPVNVTVTDWHGSPDTWNERIQQGAVMLAAHLWRRRGTPAGVASFGEDGVAYVQKHDPQVAMLLGLGGWTTPRVG